MKKCVFTLCVDDYAPKVTALTFPWMQRYAEKIGADFHVIAERRFPDWPVTYEKLQIHQLGRAYDWSIFFDADVLVHPDLFDITDHLDRDTALHWGADLLGNRFGYDHCFRRDGRHLGSGNWLAVASNWCLDLWRPLDDITLEQALAKIHPTIREKNFGITAAHLIDDYALSRNIARHGLKFKTFLQVQKELDRSGETYFFHNYLLREDEKIAKIKEHVEVWELNGVKPELEPFVQKPAILSNEARHVLEELNGRGILMRN